MQRGAEVAAARANAHDAQHQPRINREEGPQPHEFETANPYLTSPQQQGGGAR
jgi:hypothetical protein